MQRLVYSPKAYAWVKVEGQSLPVDISQYIVSGSVNRRVNAVSSAEITLRNPNMKFTKGAKYGRPFFKPMDPITIWLQRIKGKPVQVFTGYLDSTPYLQLYPGTCTIKASCTLKRLLHTYWDPALPYVRNFMAEYDWMVTGNGLLINPSAQSKGVDKENPQLTDGSIGNLLFATLNKVGDWQPKSIHIERLPHGLIRRVSDTYYAFAEDAAEIRDEFESFLKKYIGDATYGDAGPGVGSGPRAGSYTGPLDRDFPKGSKATISFNEAAMLAEMAGLPGVTFAQIAIGESELQPGAVSPDQGFGLWQMTPRVQNADTVAKWESIGSYFNPWRNALMAKFLVKDGGVDAIKRNWYGTSHVTDWNKHYTGPMPKSRLNKGRGEEDEDDNERPDGGPDESRVASAIRPARSRNGGSSKNEEGSRNTISTPVKGLPTSGWPGSGGQFGAPRSYGGHGGVDAPSALGADWFSIVDGEIAMINEGWYGSEAAVVIKSSQKFDGYPDPLYLGYGSLRSVSVKEGQKVTAGQKIGEGGSHGSGPHLHFWLSASGTATNGDRDPEPFLKAAAAGKVPPQGTSGDGQKAAPGGGGSQTPDDMLPQAKAAAFVQAMEFPGIMETLEAIGLRGPKSLMNDKPLFPFIEQLSGAALRSFQSLPNGDFFAFYPDYFGTEQHRKPYWMIRDIEITEGKIQLNDDALCTHMFVVGDTMPNATPNGVEAFERLISTGVVNLYNFAQSGFFASGGKSKADKEERIEQLGRFRADPDRVINFLAKYGARPVLKDAPFIKSPYFEAFLAYREFQLAWSNQFLTDFQFTFMPELYPGGLVGFPDHGLQCYVDEVVHNFNYESGFQTTATLSAPASLGGTLSDDPLQYGLVRAGANPGGR